MHREIIIGLSLLVVSSYAELNPFGCGQAPSAPTSGRRDVEGVRITGGGVAIPNSWPWHGMVFQSNVFTCGGSIVDFYWFVTAATCVQNIAYKKYLKKNKRKTFIFVSHKIWILIRKYIKYFYRNPNSYTVKVGTHAYASTELYTQVRQVQRIFAHPSYDYFSHNNDIALVKFNLPLSFTVFVNAICVPSMGTYDTGTRVGWATGYIIIIIYVDIIHTSACANTIFLIK